MARHRVGDSYLSEEEYAEHKSENWEVGLFFLVGIFVGLMVYGLTITIEIKLLRFALVICSGVFFGYLAARFSEVIRMILGVIAAVGFLYFIGTLIWNAM